MSITVYGIPNCDTVRKARGWLDGLGLTYTFHDYKKAGIEPDRLAVWCRTVGWEKVLNRAGSTFRKLPEAERADLDETGAIALMVASPSAIRRPVLEHAGGLLIGFKPEEWEAAL